MVKGDVENPIVEIPLNNYGKLDVAGAVGKDGSLTVIRDLGFAQPTIGSVPIVSGEIAEDVTYYYAVSEQVPTVCSLGVLVNPDLTVASAGGFLVQLLPGADDSVIDRLEANINKLPAVSQMIADGMNVPLEKVYGVATFYAQFALSPKGVYNISVCLGTACYVKGSGDLFNKLSETLGIGSDECTEDGKFSLTACRCIGACGLAPVLTVNDDVYGRLTVDDIPGILAKYAD